MQTYKGGPECSVAAKVGTCVQCHMQHKLTELVAFVKNGRWTSIHYATWLISVVAIV